MALNATSGSKYRFLVPGSQKPTGPESSMLFSPQGRNFLSFFLKDDKEQSSRGPGCHWREKFKLLCLRLKLLAPLVILATLLDFISKGKELKR